MVGLAILLGLVGVVTIVVASVGPRTGGVSGLPVLPRPIEQWLAQLLERAAMAGPPILIVLIAVGGGVAVAVTLLLVRGSFVLGAVGSVVPGIVIGTASPSGAALSGSRRRCSSRCHARHLRRTGRRPVAP